jgi:hypothetical protein
VRQQRLTTMGTARTRRRYVLDLLTTAEAMPVAWCLANPKLGEREVAQELLGQAREQGTVRTGMIVLADEGLAGRDMER